MRVNLPIVSNAVIDDLLDTESVCDVLDQAFSDLAQGNASVLARQRTGCGETQFSAMGGVWERHHIAGTKSYTTLKGQFNFLITLPDTRYPASRRMLEGEVLTRVRTAALTRLVARNASIPPKKLAVFGVGVQGRAQAEALCEEFEFQEVGLVDPLIDKGWCDSLAQRYNCAVCIEDPKTAVCNADIVVTATRSKTPVFDGRWLQAGALVIANGISQANGRELDEETLQRAARLHVEWKPQSLMEAGDLVADLASGALDRARVSDLVDIYSKKAHWRSSPEEIVVFKSVGIGLSDVAAAWLAMERI